MPRQTPPAAKHSDLRTPILAVAARLQGAEIKAGRERSGLTQQQAADLCGVGYATWTKIEYGKRQAPAEIRERLAKAWHLDRARLGLRPETNCPCCGTAIAERLC
jgi:DNA-binding XRE family transcriptional regulator